MSSSDASYERQATLNFLLVTTLWALAEKISLGDQLPAGHKKQIRSLFESSPSDVSNRQPLHSRFSP
jgi:hypothetical protein